MNSTKPDRYAVMGNPIAHSKSPDIHKLFAEQCKQNLSYEAILVDLDNFNKSVNNFAQENGKGLNITVPFKQQAWDLVNERSQRAELAGAVNTITINNGQYTGDNTDGIGLVTDLLKNHLINLQNQRILIIGAGGAVRGVLLPILEQQPQSVTIANRTHNKAIDLADLFSDFGNIKASGFEQLSEQTFDLIINGTAASLQGDVPPVPVDCINESTHLYDMMYASEPTSFMVWGKQHGAESCMDGLGMLVEQAAESFYIWRGIRPETKTVIAALRGKIKN
ncbi:MAG: shikimate dehydrogenase [Gammaproteobacteria bacterium]|nr:shikimate dehydrogenase [Gammaproteobacteria bacterium]